MASRDLLIEIGTEELPPKALKTLSEAFTTSVTAQLAAQQLSHDGVRAYASPRRLALWVKNLDEQAPDSQVEIWGPPATVAFDKDGKPTKAAAAFAQKNGIAVADLKNCVASDGKQDKLCYRSVARGAQTVATLGRLIDAALAALPIPKRMRWGVSRAEFVRPIHWIAVLFGNDTVACDIMGIKAGNTTRGHRFHCNRELVITAPADYEKILREEGKVIADFDKRRELIREQVSAVGQQLGGNAVIDGGLLDEVTALVEWPQALAGGFEQRFLAVPPEALISSMKEHQKYFHVVDAGGQLMPHFITVANIDSTDPQKVIAGNERVIRPRLADAAFFFETDCKTSLADRRERLKTVVFQEKLGTVYDKTRRVAAIAHALAEELDADPALASRAGELCKSDLVTEMVFEFADMQGIAGYYYARNDGEPDELATAMNEQYLPRYAGDALPATKTGVILALADRLDTVVGIFGIGQPPSGSRDPFALRRACLGILRIIIEKQLPLDLRSCIRLAMVQHGALPAADVEDTVLAYMIERLRAYYEDQAIAAEVFMAVTTKHLSQPVDIDRRVHAVAQFSRLPQAQALAAANKRVSNILAKQDSQPPATVDEALLQERAEQALASAVQQQQRAVQPLFAAGEYAAGLTRLAGLREAVDDFFDQVMVMVDDEALRNNRLALLAQLQALFLNVADISLLVPGKG